MLDTISHRTSRIINNSSLTSIICLSTLVRIALISYGYIHDLIFKVKYTDIDYIVFSDAAQNVCNWRSPYERETYRYTPLLAWMLVPNCYMPLYGKILFSTLDVLTGLLIYFSIDCKLNRKLSTCFWLFNPINIVVCTRGNAESVMCILVLLTLFGLRKGRLRLSAIVYGLSVHFKVYPIIYALPLYLYCGDRQRGWGLLVSKKGVEFGLISAGVFLSLAALFYKIYGYEFLAETYFYHITRSDTKHNFSPYFYMLHLSQHSSYISILSALAFLPQLLLILLVGGWMYWELELAVFVQTAVFATYNKVVTSQGYLESIFLILYQFMFLKYFLWYLSLLPLIIPHSSITFKRAVAMFSSWILGQLLWLFPAYLFEFEGYPTYPLLWLAGLLFFFINVYNIVLIIRHHK